MPPNMAAPTTMLAAIPTATARVRNILSGISVDTFRTAVVNGDHKTLSQISGVGKKTAERIVVELKDKLGSGLLLPGASSGALPPGSNQKLNDAVAALMTLQFKPNEALESVKAALAVLGAEATVEEVIRVCLKRGRS